jgi:transcriptional regulator GlxA family with amidase domain
MTEQQLELNVRREHEIGELRIAIDWLEQEIAKQKPISQF